MSNTTPATTIAAASQNDAHARHRVLAQKKQKLAVGAGIFVLLLVVVAIFAPGSCRSTPRTSSTTTRSTPAPR